jgi:hypothetical protein
VIEKILEYTSQYTEDSCCFALDICLLMGDEDSIRTGKRVVISNALYRGLMSKGYNCFLYSSRAHNPEFSDKWKNAYFRLSGEPKDSVSIAFKRDFTVKALINDDIEGLIKMCSKEN